jgi:hypothetical protein
MQAKKLQELRQLLASKQPQQRENWLCSRVGSGIPRGAITQISGYGKTAFVLSFLGEHPDLRVAWVEATFSAYPVAFTQHRANLERVLFVEAEAQAEWCALQLLRAPIFAVVALYLDSCRLDRLRRLQLAAETSQASLLWMTSRPQQQWPVSLQLQVERAPGGDLQARVLRQRF